LTESDKAILAKQEKVIVKYKNQSIFLKGV